MNTLIIKILCWINGIKNPFAWAYEQEIKEMKMKYNGTNEMPWYMNIFNKDAIENFAKEHEKRNYKSIEHVIDNARFFMESTHELAYDHGYAQAKRDYGKMIEDIKQEIVQSIENGIIQILKGNEELFSIIDKHLEGEE